MKIGDIVALVDDRYGIAVNVGVVDAVDPEQSGDTNEIIVVWNDGDETYERADTLEVVCK